MKKQRKHDAPEEKVAILRRHPLEQVPISELCEKHGLQPTVFYRLAERVLREWNGCLSAESAAWPFRRAGTDRLRGEEDPDEDEVLAELMAEHVALKKTLGEL